MGPVGEEGAHVVHDVAGYTGSGSRTRGLSRMWVATTVAPACAATAR